MPDRHIQGKLKKNKYGHKHLHGWETLLGSHAAVGASHRPHGFSRLRPVNGHTGRHSDTRTHVLRQGNPE